MSVGYLSLVDEKALLPSDGMEDELPAFVTERINVTSVTELPARLAVCRCAVEHDRDFIPLLGSAEKHSTSMVGDTTHEGGVIRVRLIGMPDDFTNAFQAHSGVVVLERKRIRFAAFFPVIL